MSELLYFDGQSKVVRTSLAHEGLRDNESGGDLSLNTIVSGIARDIEAIQHFLLRQANQTSHAVSTSDETYSSSLGQHIYIQNPLIGDICSGTLPECFDSEEDARAQAYLLRELGEAILDAKMAQRPQNATAHVGEMESINLPLIKHQVRSDLVAFCNRHLWICVRSLPSSDTPAALFVLFRAGNVSDDAAASVETLLSTAVQRIRRETTPISPPRSRARLHSLRHRHGALATTVETDTDEEERQSSTFTYTRQRASTEGTAYTHTSQATLRRLSEPGAYTPRSCWHSELPSLPPSCRGEAAG